MKLGNGTIFYVSLSGSGAGAVTVLHNFTGGSGGGLPYGGVSLSPDGKTLYGMTWKGGSADVGVVYSLYVPTRAFQVLHSFTVN